MRRTQAAGIDDAVLGDRRRRAIGRCLPVASTSPRPQWTDRLAANAARIQRALASELGSIHPRLALANLLAMPLPQLAFPRLRAAVYRLAGISIGSGSLVAGLLQLIGHEAIEGRLKIARSCWINTPLFADLTGDITIGDGVTLGHHLVLITATHREGSADRRAGTPVSAPIVVGDGAWIGARVTILPGVTVGAGAIVGAGSLVTRDVPEGTLVFGSPARVVRQIDGASEPLYPPQDLDWQSGGAPEAESR